MHEYSTRAMQNRRQSSAIKRGLLAAALALALPSLAATAALDDNSSIISDYALSAQSAPHDVSVTLVQLGEEGLQLSARLEEEGGNINRDIRWRVQGLEGEILSDVTAPVASLSLPPGSYTIYATYGSANFSQTVELKEGKQLAINFVFNIGAMRVLAMAEGLDLEQPARNLIYSTSGKDRGKLVTISQNPGEVLRLPAGTYRVESRLEPGNAVSISDITIRPGVLSAVQITHQAGVAHLSYAGNASGEVHWQILSETGTLEAGIEGASGTAVLKPGTYQAEAQVAGQTMSATFAVSAGQQETVTLGN